MSFFQFLKTQGSTANSGLFQSLYMGSAITGFTLGIYGRRRTRFARDFTYNKFHFGIYVNLASSFGIYLC